MLRIWGVVLRYACVEPAGEYSLFVSLIASYGITSKDLDYINYCKWRVLVDWVMDTGGNLLVMSCGDSLFDGCGNPQIWLFTLVYITKLFKNTTLKVAYTTNNNLGKLLDNQKTRKPNRFDKNGVYQLTCPTCQKEFVEQTGRPFHVRFREHYRDYKYVNNKSKFAQHVIEEGHAFGPINVIMDTTLCKQGQNAWHPWKVLHLRETQRGNQINDKLTIQSNPIFEALIQNNPDRGQWTQRAARIRTDKTATFTRTNITSKEPTRLRQT